jgi:hypothetical protein
MSSRWFIVVLSLDCDALLHDFDVFEAHTFLLGSFFQFFPFFDVCLLSLDDWCHLLIFVDYVGDALLLGLLVASVGLARLGLH